MAGIEIDETKVALSPQPSAPSEQLPLFAPEVVAKVRRDHARWRADAAKKAPWKNDFTTVSGMEVNPLATPDDVANLDFEREDRKSTRLNSSHRCISYAVFCLKKKKKKHYR